MLGLRPIVAVSSVLLLLGISLFSPLQAQEEQADSQPAPNQKEAKSEEEAKKKSDDKQSDDPLQEWQTLTAQKVEISQKLQELRQQFNEADNQKKRQIRNEFTGLITEFQQKIYPRIKELAPTVLEQKPQDIHAAEAVMDVAFKENNYKKAAQIGDRMIEAGKTTPTINSIAGVSHFALHDFAQAKQILENAQKSGEFTRLGARYLAPAEEYIELWKEEQAVRKKEAQATGNEALPRVQFETTKGTVQFELFENQAPNTVANFISLVEAGKYDGIAFHRVIPNFMVQGGDPNTLDDDPSNDGQGGPGYTIDCECYRDDARMHFRGSLSMAHAGKDTGGSQFFITHLPTPHLNPNPERETGHTVFGRVIEGMEVVHSIEKGDKITSAKVLRKRDHEYEPETNPKPQEEAAPSREDGGKKKADGKKKEQ